MTSYPGAVKREGCPVAWARTPGDRLAKDAVAAGGQPSTLEAQRRLAPSPLSKREICRRLGTSATQLYRLLDQTNYGKSVDQVLRLLRALDCDVDLVVRARTA
jgi:hypothetical protein